MENAWLLLQTIQQKLSPFNNTIGLKDPFKHWGWQILLTYWHKDVLFHFAFFCILFFLQTYK